MSPLCLPGKRWSVNGNEGPNSTAVNAGLPLLLRDRQRARESALQLTRRCKADLAEVRPGAASTLAHSYQVARRQLSHGGSAGLGMESGKPAQTASPLLRARKRCSHRLRPVPSSVKSSEDAGKRFILPSRDWRTRFHGPFLKGRRRETHADPRGEARRRSGSPRAPPSARGTRSTAAGGGAVITVY